MRRIATVLLTLVGILLAGSHGVWAGQREESNHTIVPGVRVGDYTLGMSKDDVLKELGEPEAIQLGEDEVVRRGEEKYSLNNLPSNYILSFGGVSFWIDDDSVEAISVHSPLYKLSNGLGVGDSEQKIIQAFGEDFHLREALGRDFLCYDAKGLAFEIHKKNQTVGEILVYESATVKPIESIKPFDDVRSKDLSELDLSSSKGVIATLAFDQQTVWPKQAKMPPGSDPKKILADGMNPGLGIRELHQQGTTGKGVNVAIIDQPLLPDHPEYDGKIVAYHDTGCGGEKSSMHGPAVASLLVGKNCGTAPDARVYYAAAPSWKRDAAYYAKGLDWIIARNEKLPEAEKIRVVSVSASPNQSSWANRQMWDRACARAEADGIMVLDGTDSHRGFISSCWYDVRDPESVGKCNPGLAQTPWVDPTRIHVPASCRTTAKSDGDCRDSYVYWGRGGESWTFPYCAGVLAMGWQIRPDLTPAQMKEMLFASAHVQKSGAKIINPRAFIDLVRKHSRDQQHIRTRPQTDSKTYTIVPGLRVGDYTLGMSKDDVLKKLGEPESIQLGEDEIVRRGQEKYNLNNLPRKYIMAFGDVSFWIFDDSVKVIGVHSPLYKFANRLGVGDSEQKIKQAFGEDFQPREILGKHFLCYDAKGLGFEIHKKNQTVTEILVFRPEGVDSAEAALIRKAAAEGRILFRLTTPQEFKEIAGQPTREWTAPGGGITYMTYPGIEEVKFFGRRRDPRTILHVLCEGMRIDIGEDRPIVLRHEGDLDNFGSSRGYCGVDLSRLDLSQKGELLKKMPFDSHTVWPESDRLPPGFDPEAVMEWGKYPGLGVKQLHDQGITGKGVHMAIIDSPLLLDHIEYAGKLAGYTVHTADADPSSHGPAVASFLVGKTCGVAPGALLHCWTVFSWDLDKYQCMAVEQKWKLEHKYRCMAVEQIIEFNKGKEKSEQIRILSVSKGFAPSELNLDGWKTALEKAEQAGIYVFHCGGDPEKTGFGVGDRFLGAGCRFLKDSDNPANYQPCVFLRSNHEFLSRLRLSIAQRGPVFHIFIPIDNRTRANQKAKDAYTFAPRGGASWAAPYVAGVVALGMQVNPDLRADQVNKLLYDSGWDFQTGRLINPIGFVEAARTASSKDPKYGRRR